jgi:hypothetical protein
LVTWSLGHLVTWSLGHLVKIFILELKTMSFTNYFFRIDGQVTKCVATK